MWERDQLRCGPAPPLAPCPSGGSPIAGGIHSEHTLAGPHLPQLGVIKRQQLWAESRDRRPAEGGGDRDTQTQEASPESGESDLPGFKSQLGAQVSHVTSWGLCVSKAPEIDSVYGPFPLECTMTSEHTPSAEETLHEAAGWDKLIQSPERAVPGCRRLSLQIRASQASPAGRSSRLTTSDLAPSPQPGRIRRQAGSRPSCLS